MITGGQFLNTLGYILKTNQVEQRQGGLLIESISMMKEVKSGSSVFGFINQRGKKLWGGRVVEILSIRMSIFIGI